MATEMKAFIGRVKKIKAMEDELKDVNKTLKKAMENNSIMLIEQDYRLKRWKQMKALMEGDNDSFDWVEKARRQSNESLTSERKGESENHQAIKEPEQNLEPLQKSSDEQIAPHQLSPSKLEEMREKGEKVQSLLSEMKGSMKTV